MSENENWDLEIKSKNSWFEFNLPELWKYRDLIVLFVRRDFVAQFKQTILGPLWHLIQPIFTTFLFVVVFGKIANLKTDGSPGPLFYLSGIIVWNFFAGCLMGTANTFVANAGIFGKIYFPRLVLPISTVISTIIRFGIQFGLFLIFLIYYLLVKQLPLHLNGYLLLIPCLVVIMSVLGLGFGILISSLSTKYKDLTFFLGFGVQLLMYLTPVIYPAALWNKYQWIMDLNPMTPIIESFRFAMMGHGKLEPTKLLYSSAFAIVLFFVGLIFFHRTEKTFIDTV